MNKIKIEWGITLPNAPSDERVFTSERDAKKCIASYCGFGSEEAASLPPLESGPFWCDAKILVRRRLFEVVKGRS